MRNRFSAVPGVFVLLALLVCSRVSAQVANDLCDGAQRLTLRDVAGARVLTATAEGDTKGATDDPENDNCGNSSAPGLWYSVSGVGAEMTASLCGSNYDTRISVFSGDCGAVECVASNDDFCGLQSEVNWDSEDGGTYLILVHGYSSSSGGFELNVTTALPPANLANILHDEAQDGELSGDRQQPTQMPPLNPGANEVALQLTRRDFDRDVFTFEVPTGTALTEVFLQDFSSNGVGSYASISLRTGRNAAKGEMVEFINWNGNQDPLDLLQFDSAPGPQEAGTYVMSLSYQADQINSYVDLRIILAIDEIDEIPELPPPTYALSFTGCEEVSGYIGNPFSTDIDLILIDSDNISGFGAQSWSLGVISNGAGITEISTESTDASELFVNPSFSINELTSGDGNQGAISAAVLSFTTNTSLQPNSISTIATITVEGDLGDEESTVELAYHEGLRGRGRPVRNVITWEANTVYPQLGSCSFSVVPDVTAPAVPAGLSAEAGNGVVTLNWDDNTEGDLGGYNLSRDGSVIARGLSESAYTDEDVVNGVTYSYSVSAVDIGGNESDGARPVEATPEALGGSQRPGDYNQDSGIDLSDAISVFGFLFLGRAEPDCPSGLDFNGDQALDLSDGIGVLNWLFQGGPGHVLGSDCVQVVDCQDACN